MAYGPAPLPPLSFFFEPETLPAGQFAFNRSDAQSTVSTRLLYNRLLSCEHGEFALGGQDADLTEVSGVAVVGASPLPIWGELTLQATGAYVLTGEHGIFALNGQAATLNKGRRLVADCGTFAVSVAPAERDMEMNADPRLFQVVGQDATLTLTRRLACDAGTYALNGQDAGYVYLSGGNRTMTGEVGRFYSNRTDNLSLASTALRYNRVMTCECGVFAMNGQNAVLDGPEWQDVEESSGTWVYVTPSGGVWTDVDPDS
jgi:hypothetical protein